jgi:DNA/RNA-binding domain of Phe-tRNA-synthetase-like protein
VIRFDLEHPTLRLAVVTANEVTCVESSNGLLARMQAAETRVRDDPASFPERVRAAVRDVLRFGGYKPTGRGKPASEFLFGAAKERGLPRVNNLVDINNLVSLTSALPVSIFDRQKLGGDTRIRFGRAGEKYVFNGSGQEMNISGIPVVCRAANDEPVGNAVKDSMLAKVGPDTRQVVAVVYGSRSLPQGHLALAATQLVELLQMHASAVNCETYCIPE